MREGRRGKEDKEKKIKISEDKGGKKKGKKGVVR